MTEQLYKKIATKEGYAYEPVNNSGQQASSDGGKTWHPAKQEPYYPMGLELLKCTFGFHELVQSQKYAHTKYCFRCGKRKQDKNFDY